MLVGGEGESNKLSKMGGGGRNKMRDRRGK